MVDLLVKALLDQFLLSLLEIWVGTAHKYDVSHILLALQAGFIPKIGACLTQYNSA